MTNDPDIKYFFIRRPIFAAVISIVDHAARLVRAAFASRSPAIRRSRRPRCRSPPCYPGATAEDVANAVAAPIEQQLVRPPGLLYYTSSNASDGTMNMQVYFDVSRDQDLAAVDVQNQSSWPSRSCRRRSCATASPSKGAHRHPRGRRAHVRRPALRRDYLSNYAKIYVQDELKRMPGVGDATTFGQARLLDAASSLDSRPDGAARPHGDRRRRRGRRAEHHQSRRAPRPRTVAAGHAAHASGHHARPPQRIRRSSRTSSSARAPTARSCGSGDIGRVSWAQRDYDLVGRLNGKPSALILVYLRPGANALDVDKARRRADGGARPNVPARASTGRCPSTRRRSSRRRSTKW